MDFTVKNNKVYFQGQDLSDHMEIKEININESGAFVTAEFKSDIDVTTNGILFAMLEEMEEGNLIDLKEHLHAEIKRRENEL